MYDRLEWGFILKTLQDVGLPIKMVNVIMSCILSGSIRLLWNGEMTNGVETRHGLRLGNPVSPYVFVLCMERLSHHIQKEVVDGNWKPIKASRRGPAISHLLFTDDRLFFSEASMSQVEVIKSCLSKFVKASWQRKNYEKLYIFFSSNLNAEEINLSRVSSIPRTNDLGRYLGARLIHHRCNREAYGDLPDKFHERLADWKAKCMSLAGQITLAKSILNTYLSSKCRQRSSRHRWRAILINSQGIVFGEAVSKGIRFTLSNGMLCVSLLTWDEQDWSRHGPRTRL